MKRTKIVCTIGPATMDKEVLKKMMLAGMNVGRFNFSHGSFEDQKKFFEPFVEARKELGLPVATLLDTQGPEIRTGVLVENPVVLKADEEFTLVNDEIVGDSNRVTVTYKELYNDVKPGTTILIDDGKIELEVIRIEGKDVVCKIMNGGELGNRKSINIPGTHINLPALKEKDIQDLISGCEHDFDYIAASFIRCKEDVLAIRKVLDDNGGKNIKIISKIESTEGIENFDSILEVTDGIMVARGDMGVEIPMEQVPVVQKEMIKKCNKAGKIVITATQMMESMTNNPRPTRAEISDVANAVYDGTSAVMLSGETASGKYPVQALKTMVETLEFTESKIHYKKRFRNADFEVRNNLDAISHTVCTMAIDVDAKCIIVNSLSGMTARMVSRFRCPVDIIGMTTSAKVWRKLNLSWGLTPVMCGMYDSMEEMFANSVQEAKSALGLEKGDNVVITGGMVNGTSGNTNLIKVEEIDRTW